MRFLQDPAEQEPPSLQNNQQSTWGYSVAISMRCECGQRVRVRDDQSGKRLSCPRCGVLIVVPGSNPEGSKSSPTSLLSNDQLAQSESGYPTSTGILGFLIVLLIAWAVLVLTGLAVASLLPILKIPVFLLGAVASVLMIGAAGQLLFAKRHVLARRELDLFYGFAKLVSWDPTEAVLILKDKMVSYVDDNLHDGGGIRLIWPVLGEELACRAPLEIQTLDFKDDDVLTREYLPLTVQGTMKWRIVNLQRFYLLVSQEIRATSDSIRTRRSDSQNERRPTGVARKINSADQWLRSMAEEQTRAIVSRVNTGFLVAERIAADLPQDLRSEVGESLPIPTAPTSTGQYRTATDGLACSIHESINSRVKDFGIEVHEVTLQEIGLPPHIHQAAVDACKAAYLPFVAQKQAAARKLQLQAEADVIGRDSVAAREVVSQAPAFAIGDFLSTFLSNNRALLDTARKQQNVIGSK